MSKFRLNSSQMILLIFIVLGIVTIAGTLISNFDMWGFYDQTETSQHISPEDAAPLPE